MNVKIDELMVRKVVTARQFETVGAARERMRAKKVHALPVIDDEGQPVGMLTANDLMDGVPDDLPLNSVVSPKVFTVPRYDGVHIAARVMRNHGIHHVVVTDEKRVVGVLSSFDLLRLVEDHRFVMKNPPAESKKRGTGIR